MISESTQTAPDSSLSLSPLQLARSATQRVSELARSLLSGVVDAAAHAEHLAFTFVSLLLRPVEGSYAISKGLLDSSVGALRRYLPHLPLPLLTGGSGAGVERDTRDEQDVQVVGLGGGFALNLASVEAIPQPPSPQYTPRKHGHEELVPEGDVTKRAEPGIGEAAPYSPQTPERPGTTESPHAYGERYVGHELEARDGEMVAADEPRRRVTVAGYAAAMAPYAETERRVHSAERDVGEVPERRRRLDAILLETQELRRRTAAKLQEAQRVPGRKEDEAMQRRSTTPPSAANEPMPADISGQEGRPLAPGLEALPEANEEVSEGSAHEGGRRRIAMPTAAGVALSASAPTGEAKAPGVAEGSVEAAEARLKGLFATSPGYATAAAPVVAHMPVREHLGKPGSKELLGGVQGKRVAVERLEGGGAFHMIGEMEPSTTAYAVPMKVAAPAVEQEPAVPAPTATEEAASVPAPLTAPAEGTGEEAALLLPMVAPSAAGTEEREIPIASGVAAAEEKGQPVTAGEATAAEPFVGTAEEEGEPAAAAEPAPEAEVGTVPRKLGEAEVPPPPATPTARPADEGAPAASPEIKSVAAPTPIPTPAPPTTKPVEPVTPTFPAAELNKQAPKKKKKGFWRKIKKAFSPPKDMF